MEFLKYAVCSKQDGNEAEMDKADEELRQTVKKLWPLESNEKLDLLIPPKYKLHGKSNKRKMTVGKVYAGYLILENYRSYKQSTLNNGTLKLRKSSFFNRIMGVVRSNTNIQRSQMTLNSIDSDIKNFDANFHHQNVILKN